MMKKLLCLLMSLVLAASLCAVSLAETDTEEGLDLAQLMALFADQEDESDEQETDDSMDLSALFSLFGSMDAEPAETGDDGSADLMGLLSMFGATGGEPAETDGSADLMGLMSMFGAMGGASDETGADGLLGLLNMFGGTEDMSRALNLPENVDYNALVIDLITYLLSGEATGEGLRDILVAYLGEEPVQEVSAEDLTGVLDFLQSLSESGLDLTDLLQTILSGLNGQA